MYEIAHGHYDRALGDLAGVPTAGRSEAEQANLRGLTLMLAGQTRKAIDSFDLALELQPSFATARFNRGVALLRSGNYARAAEEFAPVASDPAQPLRAMAAYHEALALDALGRHADAESWTARALEADPQLDDALLFAGVLQEQRGDLQAAGKSYKAYLDRHADSAVAMLRFGVTAQRAGYPETAKKFLERVIATAPGTEMAIEARKFLVMWE